MSKIVSSLVSDIVTPLIGLLLGPAKKFTEVTVSLGSATLMLGQFLANLLDFVIIAAIVYFVFKGLGLEKLDRKKNQ